MSSRVAQLDFFDLDVYRVSSDKYQSDMKKWVEESMYDGPPEDIALSKSFHARFPEHKASFESHLQKRYGGAWLYNEVIGHIRLHFVGNQVRGEYFRVNTKRIVKTRTKIFEHWTHKLAPERTIPLNATSADILLIVERYIQDCVLELKGRYVDDSLFKVIAPYINWRAVYERT